MRALLILIVCHLPSLALAGGGDHHLSVLPTKILVVQTVNFLLASVFLIYATRGFVKHYFLTRSEEFHLEAKKAEEAKSEAEQQMKEIAHRLTLLELEEPKTLQRVNEEAEKMKEAIMEEAKELSEKLKKDSLDQSSVELEKAKEALRKRLLDQAIVAAKERMKKEVNGSDLSRMRSEFVEKIQVVQL